VWRFLDADGRWTGVFADRPEVIGVLTPERAAGIARAFIGDTAPQARYMGTLEDADQWTLTRTVRQQMPLYRYDLDDAAGSRVYVSPRSGEVLSASTRRERVLSWFGAIPHWIYPTMLRRHADAWAWVIIVVSGLGTVMSVAGLAIGVWQFRWRRRLTRAGTARPRTPYRDFMMRWHHLLGLGFGVVTCTWVFSGLMSMNPGRWSPGSAATTSQQLAWTGGAVDPSSMEVSAADAWRALVASGQRPKEVHATRFAGNHYWVGFVSPSGARHVPAARADSSTPFTEFTAGALVAQAQMALPAARIVETTILTGYDDYYRDQERQLALPVVRVKFDDADATWMYLDPRTGAIAQKRERKSRLERWLYAGLHDFDFAMLMYRRPLWDVVMIGMSIGGVLLAVTGVVLSWRTARQWTTGAKRVRRR
jgi:hypothetical protein